MPNNLFTGFNVVRATQTVTFAAAGLSGANCSVVFEIDAGSLKSWIPGRGINPVTSFTSGKGYYIIMKADADLSAYLIPPVPGGGTPVWGAIGGLLSDQTDLQDALDTLAEAATQIGAEADAKDAAVITTLRGGVDAAGDTLAKLYALYTALNSLVTNTAPDGDNFVDTIQEVLSILSDFPEGVQVMQALNAKMNVADYDSDGDGVLDPEAMPPLQSPNDGFILGKGAGAGAGNVSELSPAQARTLLGLSAKIVGPITQAAYDAIVTKDASTMYLIVG